METTKETNHLPKGGEFLLKQSNPEDIFIPEEWDEEQQMIAQMCDEFLEAEVFPNLDRIDALEPGLMPSLLDKAGELGLLATSIPEEYEGFGKDFLTGMLITERAGAGHSFAVALACHTGIGTLPILYFGNEEQKKKYLPKLASGEMKAAYCLTEPGSGSDALAAKTKAVLSEDGEHYILNGQKMWITNAGFADVFTVFAKVDGDKFTAFIVERGVEGLTFGEEEKKMGIKGSSTRQVFFTDVKVPKENVLGQIGRGHKIAFNILNIGRAKLAGATLGGAKRAVDLSINYANERHQFGKAISSFGAIQHKLAEQAIQTFALETALYRASKNIQDKKQQLLDSGKSFADAVLGAAEEYNIECAILKVLGSEVLDYVVDEGVQIYGGYGFSADFPMDRAYRDSRINRIFEGTNEINRLLTVDMIFRRAMKGELNFMGAVKKIQEELMAIPDFGAGEPEGLLAKEAAAIENMKKVLLVVAGAAAQKFMKELEEQQEIMLNLASIGIWIYAAESMMLRVQKLAQTRGAEGVKEYEAMVKVYVADAAAKVRKAGEDAINAFAEGDMQRMLLLGLKRFTKVKPENTMALRRQVAAAMIGRGSLGF